VSARKRAPKRQETPAAEQSGIQAKPSNDFTEEAGTLKTIPAMSELRNVNGKPRVLGTVIAQLVGDNHSWGDGAAVGVYKSALEALSNEIRSLYFLFHHSGALSEQDLPAEEILQQMLYMANRAKALSEIEIVQEVQS
jgi:hypothetical protein